MANKYGQPHVPKHLLLAQSAKDASRAHDDDYVIHLEHTALTYYVKYVREGNIEKAEEMLSRNLGQALMGNDGD